MEVLGIEISGDGGGIRGCVIDTRNGELLSEPYYSPSLTDTAPHKVLARLHDTVNKHFQWKGPVGCSFPATVNRGVVLSTRLVNAAWLDTDATHLFSEITDNPVTLVKDSDAYGLAEMHFGAGAHLTEGTVIVLDVGEEIGSSLFRNGRLVPNTELGLIEFRGLTLEAYASDRTRRKEGFPATTWGRRLQQILEQLEYYLHPDLFILGGALRTVSEKTFPYIEIKTSFTAAEFAEDAGLIGAAWVAAEQQSAASNR